MTLSRVEKVVWGLHHPPTPITNTRTITLHQSIDDQVIFHLLRGPLRVITRGGALPSKTETMRAAMEACAVLERRSPGAMVGLLDGWRSLIPCSEAPMPTETMTIPREAAAELLAPRPGDPPHPMMR